MNQSNLTSETAQVVTELVGTKLDGDSPLMSAGLDSIGATELAQKLSDRFGLKLPSTLLFDCPCVNVIARSLIEQYGFPKELAQVIEVRGVGSYGSARSARTMPLDRESLPVADVRRVVRGVLLELGTAAAAEASLMSAGLDSIAATELSHMLSEAFNVVLPSTLLFDHPATDNLIRFISSMLKVT